MRKIIVKFVLTVIFLISFFAVSATSLPSMDTDQSLGLAVMGEGNGAYYVGTVNQTIQGLFTVKNIGTILANCSITNEQTNGPIGSLNFTTDIFQFMLYPQESTIVYFTVTLLQNITDLMSVDWMVTGIGEERTEEGSSTVSVAIACRSFFQIYGYSGILTIVIKDQNDNNYNNLICQIRRDYLIYANKSTRNGAVEFLLSIPANYSLSIYRNSIEVYQQDFELRGDRRLKLLIERPSTEIISPAVFHLVELAIGLCIGYALRIMEVKHRERKRYKKEPIKLSPEEKEMWDWVTKPIK